MESFDVLGKILIYATMFVILIAALGVVTLRNLFYSALSLASVLIATAGVYIYLRAEFLAGVQILLYVGAVMTLIIFAIMLTERLNETTAIQSNKQKPAVFIALSILVILIGKVIYRTPWIETRAIDNVASIETIATKMLGELVFPFELISLVLLAALIGAFVIAKKDLKS